MSLSTSPLLYVFFEASQLATERALFEHSIGLPVLEIEPHLPHHRHGVVKYDAVNLILSLNLSGPGKFAAGGSEGLVTVFRGDPAWPIERLREHPGVVSADADGWLTDVHGHRFLFLSPSSGGAVRPAWPAVEELRLTVGDLSVSVPFYRDILGLEVLDQKENLVRFATGSVVLALECKQAAPDGCRQRYDTYLVVFGTPEIEQAHAALLRRGLLFKSPRVAVSEIGGTVRFEDPSGHRFCLYEPSEESLTWGSGAKVMEVMGSSRRGARRH